jgi:hypothetical protein
MAAFGGSRREEGMIPFNRLGIRAKKPLLLMKRGKLAASAGRQNAQQQPMLEQPQAPSQEQCAAEGLLLAFNSGEDA